MSDDTFYLIFGIYSYFIDALCLAPPWFLLILSSLSRHELLKTIGLTKLEAVFVRNRNAIVVINVIKTQTPLPNFGESPAIRRPKWVSPANFAGETHFCPRAADELQKFPIIFNKNRS